VKSMRKKVLKDVSLITTVLNEEDNIHEFIKSILDQTVLPREFIIVDGGSTDNTYKILKKYSEKYKWIKVYQVKGASIGKGRNIAIEKAKGKIIAVTDAGCIVDKKWLKEITKPFFKEKNIDVVVGIYKPYYTNDFEYFQGLIIVKDPKKIFMNPSRMSIRSMAFKKKCWKEVGKLPEKYGGDDTLFNIKLIENGCKFYFVREAVVYWRMRKSLKAFSKQFYKYAVGDAHYKNFIKLKKIFFFFTFLNGFIIALTLSLIISPKIFTYLLGSIILSLFLYGVFYSLKTKKITGIIWMPLLFLTKTFSYFIGLWVGILRQASRS